jgi:hypothetical protein
VCPLALESDSVHVNVRPEDGETAIVRDFVFWFRPRPSSHSRPEHCLDHQANRSQTVRHGQWSVMSMPVKEEDNQTIKRHGPGFNWANLPMGLAAISPWGTYTLHINFLCNHRVYELTKFTKKSEKIYTYSFDPTQYMYKILSSNY